MHLELSIPAYNEAPIIVETVHKVSEVLASLGISWSVVVVDNGSTDGTEQAVEALGYPNVRVVRIETRGKGAAVVSAARASIADVFGFIDADLSANPRCIGDLLQALEAGADIAIGSRLLPQADTRRGALRTLSSKIFNLLRKLLLGLSVEDTQCGLKLANRRGTELLAMCREEGWFFDIEWLARAQRAGLRIVEVPIIWDEQHFADRKSKLRLMRDGVGALAAILRIRAMK